MRPILIAHSKPDTARILGEAFANRGLPAMVSPDGTAALEALSQRNCAAIFTEDTLPGASGLDLLLLERNRGHDTKVVLVSTDTSARAARAALTRGVFDYLTEPLDTDELNACLDRLMSEPADGDRVIRQQGRYGFIIGQSPAIQKVFRLVDKVADSDSTVMIYGESGTGKELIARAIHQNSRRHDKALIPVNCGAIPEELLESELFGHEKGAFTSAIRTRIGRFELSDGGTIFLDEIADMSPKLQVKILRVLQEHAFERIGGAKTIRVDIRVITATNKDLRQAMEEGRFREDLFYRLNVIPINVPPLRQRREDIPLLVDYFLQRFRETRNSAITSIEDEALGKLISYHWPGNIRELENIIERMVILAEGKTLGAEDLPARISSSTPPKQSLNIEISDAGIDFNQVVSEFEDHLLITALEKAGWVKNRAAQLLGLNRTTLVEKLKKKEIAPPSS